MRESGKEREEREERERGRERKEEHVGTSGERRVSMREEECGQKKQRKKSRKRMQKRRRKRKMMNLTMRGVGKGGKAGWNHWQRSPLWKNIPLAVENMRGGRGGEREEEFRSV